MDLRRRGGGDCVSRGGVQRSSKVKDLLLVGHHITVVEVHFSFSARVSCVDGGRVGTVLGCRRSGVVGVGGGAGVVAARHHGLVQGFREMFLLRELFAILVVQMLMLSPVVPTGVPDGHAPTPWEAPILVRSSWGDRVLPARSRRTGGLRLATAGFVHSSDCGFGQARRWRGEGRQGVVSGGSGAVAGAVIRNQGPGAIGVSIPSSKGASEGTVMTIASDLVVAVFVVAVVVAFFFFLAIAPSPFTSGYLADIPTFVLSELAVGQK